MGIAGVMIDQRQPSWVHRLDFGENVPISVCLLDQGDLLLACDDGELLAVRRRSGDELLAALRTDRLSPEIAELRQASHWNYLALCGHLSPGPNGKTFLNGFDTNWNWASIQGALLTIQEMGCQVIHIGSDHDLLPSLVRLGNRERGPIRLRAARDPLALTDAETLLSALPGIGIDRAQTLLKHCGNAAWALSYLSDDQFAGRTVPGIGPQTKAKVRAALGLEDWAVLSVISREGDVAILPDVKDVA